jgi:hypothetical protein
MVTVVSLALFNAKECSVEREVQRRIQAFLLTAEDARGNVEVAFLVESPVGFAESALLTANQRLRIVIPELESDARRRVAVAVNRLEGDTYERSVYERVYERSVYERVYE